MGIYEKEQLYPAPNFSSTCAPSFDEMTEVISAGEDISQLFAVANMCARNGDFELAEAAYRRGMELENCPPELVSNLGILYRILNRPFESAEILSRVLSESPQLSLASVNLGEALRCLGNLSGALAVFIRAIRYDSQYVPALLGAGTILESMGRHDKARMYYERVLQNDSSVPEARKAVARYEFEGGRKLFQVGDFLAAFKVWADVYEKYPETIYEDATIVLEMAQLRKSYVHQGILAKMRRDLEKAICSRDKEIDWYTYFIHFFFSLGLIPEIFEDPSDFASEEREWMYDIKSMGEHPYARYRIGILHLYQGRLDRGHEAITKSMEITSPPKRRTLAMEVILRETGGLIRVRDRRGIAAVGNLHDQSMSSWSPEEIEDPAGKWKGEACNWKDLGFPPALAERWRDKGFAPDEASDWSHNGFLPEEAGIWRSVDCLVSAQAKLWKIGGLSPDEAAEWRLYFEDEPEKAIQFYNLGMKDAQVAKEWAQLFMFPWEAANWHQLDLSPEDAKRFKDEGVQDPYEAKRQKTLQVIDDTVH